MSKERKQYSPEFKFRIALEAAKNQATVSQLASESGVHPSQISDWKGTLMTEGASLFDRRPGSRDQAAVKMESELYEQIGRLKVELEWLKKKLPDIVEAKRALVDPEHPEISVRRQCELLGLNRASYYYQPATESVLNLELMRRIDEQYLKTPFYGRLRMTVHLQRLGFEVNHKRVQRLMQLMGLQAIYPKPRTTIIDAGHRKYPYLLRNLEIVRPNQVWSTDITYVPLAQGFMYLVVIMDWYSRYVLTWDISNTLDGLFCQLALQTALTLGKPEIFNSDQGVQFTALAFTSMLEDAGIRISMDGRGRAYDNIFVERLWRSVKYEDIYLYRYATVPALSEGLERYFILYNQERPHQSLDDRTPAEVYCA